MLTVAVYAIARQIFVCLVVLLLTLLLLLLLAVVVVCLLLLVRVLIDPTCCKHFRQVLPLILLHKHQGNDGNTSGQWCKPVVALMPSEGMAATFGNSC